MSSLEWAWMLSVSKGTSFLTWAWLGWAFSRDPSTLLGFGIDGLVGAKGASVY
jgi:hypothetical protein